MKGSNWDEVLQIVTDSVGRKLPAFIKENLVDFCVENQSTRTVCNEFLKLSKQPHAKDSVLALEKKEKGNEKYKEKKYEESISLYTESIFNASSYDECLPLAYANRALVLQLVGYPEESLGDIDMALSNGYPEGKIEVLLLRKFKCLAELGEVCKAREVLTQALKRCKKKEFHQLIQNEFEKIKGVKDTKKAEHTITEPAGGENKNFVSASNYLSVHYDKTRGRHVIATEDIQVGDVLFVEEPFAFVNLESACSNCLKRTIAPIPCFSCSEVMYCSPKCRDDFWKSIHSFECGFEKLFKSVGIAHLSLRVILTASSSLDELKSLLQNISKPVYDNGIVLYKSKGYDSVYNLDYNCVKIVEKDLFQYVMTALLLALHLKKHTGYFSENSDIEDLKLVTSVVLRHILQLICNGHAINDVMDKRSKESWIFSHREVRVGTAIYSSASMMNHSCEPSIFTSFYQKRLEVRAAKAIKKGEEVFNCYGPHARRMERVRRKEILNNQYFFECQCHACSQKYDIHSVLKAFKCSKCKGPSIPTLENSLERTCLGCGETNKISMELASQVDKFYFFMKEGEVLLNCDVILSLRKFLKAWRLGRAIFYKFHADLSNAADEIARCLLELQDFRRCILFLKCSVRSVEVRYGSLSLEAANEMKKLGDVIINYIICHKKNTTRETASSGVFYYQKAHKIMNLLCGPHYDMLKEIETNISVLENFLKNE